MKLNGQKGKNPGKLCQDVSYNEMGQFSHVITRHNIFEPADLSETSRLCGIITYNQALHENILKFDFPFTLLVHYCRVF